MSKGRPLLEAATKIWQECKKDLEDRPGSPDDEPQDGSLLPGAELKKVTKWLQQIITKFGASAAVAEGEEIDRALRPIGDEVIKAYTAAIGTLLALRRGAGPSLRLELREVGAGLAETFAGLGAAVGTPNMALCAGKALDRAKQFERLSTHNRAAVRRRILRSLAQLRDAQRELQEALNAEGHGGSDEDDDDELGGFDDTLEPAERHLAESVAASSAALEEVLKQVSHACMPGSATPDSSGSPAPTGAVLDLAVLEEAIKHAAAGVHAVDGLAASAVGGIDQANFRSSLGDLRAAASGLRAAANPELLAKLEAALELMEAALVAAMAEGEDGSP